MYVRVVRKRDRACRVCVRVCVGVWQRGGWRSPGSPSRMERMEWMMERGEKRLELQVDVRAPPRGEDARPSSPGASTAAHPRSPGVLYRCLLDLRIGKHNGGVSVQPSDAVLCRGDPWGSRVIDQDRSSARLQHAHAKG